MIESRDKAHYMQNQYNKLSYDNRGGEMIEKIDLSDANIQAVKKLANDFELGFSINFEQDKLMDQIDNGRGSS